MSIGFINIKASYVILDSLFIKVIRDIKDLIIPFCLILFHLKADLMRC